MTACASPVAPSKARCAGHVARDIPSDPTGSSSTAHMKNRRRAATVARRSRRVFGSSIGPATARPAPASRSFWIARRRSRQRDNGRIVNGDAITTLRRILADPDIGKRIGVSHLYSRIFWPKKTLPAFARAKLKRADASGRYSHMRIAQNGVTISVNRESRLD
ncbi:hypothetical protein SAMN05878503_101151 [Cereibacter ovatus]|uniref:Uncharacterized protein n=1 Tax=Cereibacter ovatus TaxID=439529 RepID=A0A285CJI9_9RHOB|nr:hypothetical protein [Cereibacter ovatus]SNX67515.1 hypothetical protein SAMN05878503_101151 [Cereibacter ovatus]